MNPRQKAVNLCPKIPQALPDPPNNGGIFKELSPGQWRWYWAAVSLMPEELLPDPAAPLSGWHSHTDRSPIPQWTSSSPADTNDTGAFSTACWICEAW